MVWVGRDLKVPTPLPWTDTPVKVLLDGILQHVNCTTQLVAGKFAEGALNSTVRVAKKGVK